MPLDTARARRYLNDFDLNTLFVEELGWDHHRQELVVPVDGQDFHLQAIAHKRGLVAFHCTPGLDGGIPPYALRRKIETQVAKSVNQHLIVYADAGHTQQVWQWVKREAGRPTAAREQSFYRSQTGEALIQKLQAVTFSLEEEEQLTLVEVAGRVKAGFDVERVTKRFYERFKAEHAAFLKFLRGIPDEAAQRWYASVMINRLMFIYFIQKKSFLDGDPNYLRTRLATCMTAAPDRYYADFLCPLFFQGFARRETDRSVEINRLLGQVPYLDGGLFQEHSVERAFGAAIQIDDAAFERLFDFFDAYHWHLDERPLRADNEINPDVLGYIFEKYINQKQMGAYYTKEDITGYISQNTIIPYLLDAARRDCRVAFEGDHSVWGLLAADPDRYIYPAMRHGTDLPLPAEIAAGVDDVARREHWNRPAPPEYALPTEIWREVVARRQRYAEVKSNLQSPTSNLQPPTSNLQTINDLVTYNLDIRQFAQDVIAWSEGPELLRAFWHAIEAVTVLDPTVGSGAFLFAALNVLEPLYEGCLERMQAFVDDLDRSAEPHRPAKYGDFRQILARVAQHPNRRYFILKSIVVNNLYGVDIMEEAVEICKLRLFLKLVAQVERVGDIEPLPDIDFNVRAGNTLVGYVSREDVKRALTFQGQQGRLLFAEDADTLQRFEARAADVERLFGLFRQQQTELGGQVTAEDKAELRRRLDALDDELNRALARAYGIDPTKPQAHEGWLAAHRPFHWFVQFYGILRDGGFDVVIGNPPYVDYKALGYRLLSDTGSSFPDIYAHVILRSLVLGKSYARIGMIVPLSLMFSEDFELLRARLHQDGNAWLSSFDNIPASIFAGVSQRCTIWLGHRSRKPMTFVSQMYRWRSEFRPILMHCMKYVLVRGYPFDTFGFPKLATIRQNTVLDEIRRSSLRASSITKKRSGGGRLRFSPTARNFISVFLEDPPCLEEATLQRIDGSVMGEIVLPNHHLALATLSIMAGDVFLWYWMVRGDGFHVTNWVVADFIGVLDSLDQPTLDLLSTLGSLLHDRRFEALVFKKNAGKYVGNFNYGGLNSLARRADLLFLTGLGIEPLHALDIFDHVRRVLSINVYAGEKSIPDHVKGMFRPSPVDFEQQELIFREIDRVLARHYGFTAKELDFIINYDIKYRMGDELEAADEVI